VACSSDLIAVILIIMDPWTQIFGYNGCGGVSNQHKLNKGLNYYISSSYLLRLSSVSDAYTAVLHDMVVQ
jgi:hypothetical protein